MIWLPRKVKEKFLRLAPFVLPALLLCQNLFAGSAALTPVYVSLDGQIATNTVSGQTCWQCKSGFHFMYFNVPSSFVFTNNTPVYVTFEYYDAGDGLIEMEYDGTPNAYQRTETHSRSSRVATLQFVNSYQELAQPVLGGHENGGADLRLDLEDDDGTLLSVVAGSVTIQNAPFTDPTFQQALSKPWLAAYTGETRNDDVDASSLTDKVMCGYQGWFGTPNDVQDLGWVHWCRSGRMITNNLNTDQWPDMTEYPSTSYFQAENIKLKSGQTGFVFSDSLPETVETQFQWMRKYNIDGIFLQRFLKNGQPPAGQNQEWTLANVRQAANLEGRVWAIEYDLSLISDSSAFSTITNDWIWLNTTFKLLQDSRYGHQNGKPVVAIYGMADTNNGVSVATANKIISWFKTNSYSGACYVWGGVPLNWQSQWNQESAVYTNFNAIQSWHSSNYASDLAKCATFGATYWPMLWPGFSWSNEQMEKSNNAAFIDRNQGNFEWGKAYNAMTNAGMANIFVGMFDEFDEGTAIMEMSDDTPPAPVGTWGGAYINNESMPSDWWLLLTQEAKAEMYRQRTVSLTMPTTNELANRSNIGPEADDTLGTNDVANRLYRVPVTYDGNTAVEVQAGKQCRYNASPQTTNHYIYFNVDDNFRYQASGLPDMDFTIEVMYYDSPANVTFQLQYDGTNNAYTTHSKSVTTQGTGRWRTVRYEIGDAYFGNRENGGADFRVYVAGNAKLDISRVWVRKDELKYQIWALNDIGSVGAAGSGSIDEITDLYTVSGSGTDIYGTSDSFTYCNQPLDGDGQVIARVNSIQNTATAAKAGVMIRSSLATNSAHVSMVLTPGEGIDYLVRPTAGASTTEITVSNIVAPYWVKIVRTGNTFNSYYAPDNGTWTLIGTTNISMPANVYMGIPVTSKNNGTLNISTFQYISVSGDPNYDNGL